MIALTLDFQRMAMFGAGFHFLAFIITEHELRQFIVHEWLAEFLDVFLLFASWGPKDC